MLILVTTTNHADAALAFAATGILRWKTKNDVFDVMWNTSKSEISYERIPNTKRKKVFVRMKEVSAVSEKSGKSVYLADTSEHGILEMCVGEYDNFDKMLSLPYLSMSIKTDRCPCS